MIFSYLIFYIFVLGWFKAFFYFPLTSNVDDLDAWGAAASTYVYKVLQSKLIWKRERKI